jgi:hypothetical protein
MLASSLWRGNDTVRKIDLDSEQEPDVRDRSFKERSTNLKPVANLYPWGGRENEWNARCQRQNAGSLKEKRADSTPEGRTGS